MGYEFLEHTADLKIRVEEPTIDEAFKTAALAIKQAMAEDIEVAQKINRVISVEGKDLQDLLYRFMEEFIFLLDADDFILSDVLDLEVIKDEERNLWTLASTISGDNASSYRFSNDVKAITFNEMKIEEDKENNKVTIYFVLDV